MPSPELHLLSAGAAQGLVRAVEEVFRAKTGASFAGTFGAVGAMRAKLLAGEPCDVVILSAAMIADLEAQGHVLPGTSAPLGWVRTGIAVRAGDNLPVVNDGATLRAALLRAQGIYIPDPKLATAGIHFVRVITKLGIHDEVAPRLRSFANGATAMRELSLATGPDLVGCTQITEISYTPGVTLVGLLPAEFELATVYTAAVCSGASEPDLAQSFVQLLSGPAAQVLRASCGFE